MVTHKVIAIAFASERDEGREGIKRVTWAEKVARRVDRRNKLYILPCQTKTKAAAANCRPVVITTHYCITTNTLEYVSK